MKLLKEHKMPDVSADEVEVVLMHDKKTNATFSETIIDKVFRDLHLRKKIIGCHETGFLDDYVLSYALRKGPWEFLSYQADYKDVSLFRNDVGNALVVLTTACHVPTGLAAEEGVLVVPNVGLNVNRAAHMLGQALGHAAGVETRRHFGSTAHYMNMPNSKVSSGAWSSYYTGQEREKVRDWAIGLVPIADGEEGDSE